VVVIGHAPGTAWQRPELVSEFLERRHTVLPLLDVQESLVACAFERHERPVERFLDIGSGDGAMSELLLSVEPQAEAVLVDYSEPMLQAAERRIGRAAASSRMVRADLREPGWRVQLPDQGFDAAVSAYAIHHLTSERKRELFAELFALLTPGALFLNMDCVVIEGPLEGLFDEQMVANAIAAEHVHGVPRSDAEVERELLRDDSDDRPDSVEDQLRWLREAGFEEVEIQFKWAEAAVFGAVKPGGGHRWSP
jgi:tRNA (cmo5U34)-methyltransferase